MYVNIHVLQTNILQTSNVVIQFKILVAS